MACPTQLIEQHAFSRQWHRRGFTLVESLIASTILGAAVVGLITPLCAAHRQSESRQVTGAAVALARQLLEEIAARPFVGTDGLAHQGPESGQTTRDTFTSAGNYDGYSDTTSSLTMLDGSTAALALPQTFTRKVSVQYLSTRSGPVAAAGDFAQVIVTVSATGEPAVSLMRLLCKYKEVF